MKSASSQLNERNLHHHLAALQSVKTEVQKVLVGQDHAIDSLLIALLAGGHCLLEGVPGLAKTLMISSLAQVLDLQFNRIQFTPDLMPSDVIGTEILEEDHTSGKRFFKFQQGPVFTNLLLADEINRTPPKTQAALLEAMQEKKISFAGKDYDLPKPFFVLATQNPIEQSGTYALPEAQLDRFLLHVSIDYPNFNEEIEIIKRTTGDEFAKLTTVLDHESLLLLQKATRQVFIEDSLVTAVIKLVRNTRPASTAPDIVNRFLRWGAGPRAGQAIVLCAKAYALLNGCLSVKPSDIIKVAPNVLRHRLMLRFEAQVENKSIDDIVSELLTSFNQ